MSRTNPFRNEYDNDLLTSVAETMCDSLIKYAIEKDVDLDGISGWNTINDLDSRFNDGGEARCARFTDLGWEFAKEYGTFREAPDDEWEWAQSTVVSKALELLPERWEAAKDKALTCDECGQRFRIDEGGVATHLTDDDEIDHDADADHVPYTNEGNSLT